MLAVSARKLARIAVCAVTITAVSAVCLVVSMNLDGVAGWFVKEGNTMEAMYCYQMMTAVDTVLGFRNWRLISALGGLAGCYDQLGRKQEAIVTAMKARDLISELTGPNSVNTCLLDAQVAQFLARNKQFTAAEHILKNALVRIDRLKLPNAWSKAYILSVLLDTYLEENKLGDSENIALALMPIDDQMQMDTTMRSYGVRERLVEVYCKTSRLDAAENLAVATLLLSENSADSLERVNAHDCLGRVLVLKGDLPGARKQFDLCLAVLNAKYGAGDHQVAYWKARYDQLLIDRKVFFD